jgi:hypothetical protein
MVEYVSWLVEEAQSCADAEIEEQLNVEMTIIKSVPRTAREMLDILYLREILTTSPSLTWVEPQEIDWVIREYNEAFFGELDAETRRSALREIDFLAEISHHLTFSAAQSFITETRIAVFQNDSGGDNSI